MGDPGNEACIEAVRGWTWEQWVSLLDRATEVGLLTAHTGGYYGIHPALPWFFRDHFACFRRGAEAERARRAFAAVMGVVGEWWGLRYNEGKRTILGILGGEEDNLRTAWTLARAQGMWNEVMGTMRGLSALYGETGRRGTLRRLVESVMPDFVDAATDGPLPNREKYWRLVNDFRVQLLRGDRDWSEAERLQWLRVHYARRTAAPALTVGPRTWNSEQRGCVDSLVSALSELGGLPFCFPSRARGVRAADFARLCLGAGDRVGQRPGRRRDPRHPAQQVESGALGAEHAAGAAADAGNDIAARHPHAIPADVLHPQHRGRSTERREAQRPASNDTQHPDVFGRNLDQCRATK